jgi:hypothetical protein
MLGVTISFGQQAPATGSHKVATTRHKGEKARPEYRPAYSENKAEIINGSTTQTVVFDQELQASGSGEKPLPNAAAKGQTPAQAVAPSQIRVDVVNGRTIETQYFYWDPERQERDPFAVEDSPPVVIGIESSNTRTAGGNKHPVVVAIESSGPAGAIPQKSAPKLEYRLFPRPKRPPYQPTEKQ